MTTRPKCVPYVRVRDARASSKYFQKCLGFTEVWVHQFEPHLPYCICVEREGIRLMLSEHRGDGSFGIHLYCYVDDLDALHAHCVANGGKALGAPEQMPWGRDFSVQDLDGNFLRFGDGVPT